MPRCHMDVAKSSGAPCRHTGAAYCALLVKIMTLTTRVVAKTDTDSRGDTVDTGRRLVKRVRCWLERHFEVTKSTVNVDDHHRRCFIWRRRHDRNEINSTTNLTSRLHSVQTRGDFKRPEKPWLTLGDSDIMRKIREHTTAASTAFDARTMRWSGSLIGFDGCGLYTWDVTQSDCTLTRLIAFATPPAPWHLADETYNSPCGAVDCGCWLPTRAMSWYWHITYVARKKAI